jgi:methyl-accepting chemotaxis protein
MKFGSKIILLALLPAALFIGGLVVSMGSLMLTRASFDHYLESEQRVEQGASEMYAQGLQMGQALRNVVLDPANPKALENFKSGQAAYDKAAALTQQASSDAALQSTLQDVARLRASQALAQEKVLSLVGNNAEAVAALNQEETPAWRLLRAELLKLREAAAKSATQVHTQVNNKADFAIVVSLLVSVLALVVSVVLSLLMRSTVRKELGGDPADARLALEKIAQGDLHVQVSNAGGDVSLMAALQRMQSALTSLVSGVRHSADSIATATDEIAAGSHDLSDRTERQASSLQQTASSSEQLGTQVQQNAQSAHQANQLALSASLVARQGGEVVGQVVQTMKGINDASRKIADIIGVIDGIAFQTNILALNAAVEAARAGEQGRGFAVVASEVRSLAGRSAEAAKEIKTLIGASVDRVEQGTLLVDKAGQTMTEVVDAIGRVTSIMAAITAASSEQAQGVALVGAAVQDMDRSTQQNAALVEQMAAAASSLKGQASELVQAVAVFKLDDQPSARRLGAPAPGRLAHGLAPARLAPSRASAALPAPGGTLQGINLESAIKAHADWRAKLRLAAQKNEHTDAQTLGRDDCCELGKWLHGSGTRQCGGVPSFAALLAAHKSFHFAAGKVATAINQGHGAEVEGMMGNGSAFTQASGEVTRLIVQLRKECSAASATKTTPARIAAPAARAAAPAARLAAPRLAPARVAPQAAPMPSPKPAAASADEEWETF